MPEVGLLHEGQGAYLYQEILCPAAMRMQEPGPAPAPTAGKTALNAELARIRAAVKPLLMGEAAFAELQASQIAAAKRAAGDKDGEDHREGEGGQYDPKRPLYDAVLAEVNAHAGMLRDEYQKFSTAQFKGQLYEPYGKPLTHGTNERSEFWPSQKSIKPLMYFCAKTLLAGDCNATASCERTHSKTTLITRSLRASMKADTVERLTMGAVYSRQILESMMDSPSKIVSLEQELERQELEEEQAAVQEAGRLAAEAAEAAAAMT